MIPKPSVTITFNPSKNYFKTKVNKGKPKIFANLRNTLMIKMGSMSFNWRIESRHHKEDVRPLYRIIQ